MSKYTKKLMTAAKAKAAARYAWYQAYHVARHMRYVWASDFDNSIATCYPLTHSGLVGRYVPYCGDVTYCRIIAAIQNMHYDPYFDRWF